VERFGRHADQRHDLQELLFARVTELLDVVAACNRRTRLIEKGVLAAHLSAHETLWPARNRATDVLEMLSSNPDWDTDYSD
jgi:hypothetical protein